MKQSAIEWLVDVLTKNGFIAPILVKEEIEQAKEMEKQQIIDAYETGDKYKFEIAGEQYYNETFKKEII
jgi:hypothetical protein